MQRCKKYPLFTKDLEYNLTNWINRCLIENRHDIIEMIYNNFPIVYERKNLENIKFLLTCKNKNQYYDYLKDKNIEDNISWIEKNKYIDFFDSEAKDIELKIRELIFEEYDNIFLYLCHILKNKFYRSAVHFIEKNTFEIQEIIDIINHYPELFKHLKNCTFYSSLMAEFYKNPYKIFSFLFHSVDCFIYFYNEMSEFLCYIAINEFFIRVNRYFVLFLRSTNNNPDMLNYYMLSFDLLSNIKNIAYKEFETHQNYFIFSYIYIPTYDLIRIILYDRENKNYINYINHFPRILYNFNEFCNKNEICYILKTLLSKNINREALSMILQLTSISVDYFYSFLNTHSTSIHNYVFE